MSSVRFRVIMLGHDFPAAFAIFLAAPLFYAPRLGFFVREVPLAEVRRYLARGSASMSISSSHADIVLEQAQIVRGDFGPPVTCFLARSKNMRPARLRE